MNTATTLWFIFLPQKVVFYLISYFLPIITFWHLLLIRPFILGEKIEHTSFMIISHKHICKKSQHCENF